MPKLHHLQNVIAHEGNVNCVSIGEKTNQIFVSGGDDCVVNLWQIGNSNPKVCFGPFQYAVTAVKLSLDEERLLIGLGDGTVVLYDLNDNKCISNWSQNKSSITAFCFSITNPEIVLVADKSGKFLVLSTNRRTPLQAYSDHIGSINSIAISADGVYTATCGDDRKIHIYDLTMGKHIMTLTGHSDCIYDCIFHPIYPLLISCGSDRSVKFYDLKGKDEVPNDISLDSAPVDLIKMHPGNEILITCSSDYLKFISVQPPFKITDLFTIALETIKDFTVNNYNITIASSVGDQLMIHRTKIDFFKPFKNQPKSFAPELDGLNSTKMPQGISPQTPKLLDIAAMPVPTRNRMGPKFKLPEKQEQSPAKGGKGIGHSSSSSSVSSGRNGNQKFTRGVVKTPTKPKPTFPSKEDIPPASQEADSSNPPSAKSSASSKASNKKISPSNSHVSKPTRERYDLNSMYGNNPAFAEFKKNRTAFMTKMNDRYSHLSRINDVLGSEGLTKALENATKNGELGPELLTILRMKPECVKFEHAVPMLQICDKLYAKERDLVISTIESLMQAFGRLVVDTLAIKDPSQEPVFQQRLKRSKKFAELFKQMAPFLRSVAVGQSTSAGTAGELIDEWQILLK